MAHGSFVLESDSSAGRTTRGEPKMKTGRANFVHRPAALGKILSLAAVLSMLPVFAQAAPPRFAFNCPAPGQVMVGIQGWQGWWMDGVRAVCANVNVTSGAVGGNLGTTPVAGTEKGTMRTFRCPHGQAMVGFSGGRRTYVDQIETISCRAVAAGGLTHGPTMTINAFPTKRMPQPPQSGHQALQGYIGRVCGEGQAVVGIDGNAGTFLDTFAMTCSYLPGATLPAPTTPTVRPPRQRTNTTTVTPPAGAPDLEPVLQSIPLRHVAEFRKLHGSFCSGMRSLNTSSTRMITVPDLRWGVSNSGDADAAGTFEVQLRAGTTVLQRETVMGLAAGEIRTFSYSRPQSVTEVGRIPTNPTQETRDLYKATGGECVHIWRQSRPLYEWVDPRFRIVVDPAGAIGNDSNPANNSREF
jgi:hypothetical protein